MTYILPTLLLLLGYLLPSLAQSGSFPLQIPASNHVYGPDGPWQAVSVQLGNPAQSLDLYPGGVFQSIILTNQLCYDITINPCGSGGLFDPETSDTIDDTSIDYERGDNGTSTLWTNGAMLFSYGNSTSIRDQLQIAGLTLPVANFSAIMFPNITTVYPDGNYPLQVGGLSLGPTINMSFAERRQTPSINASLIPGTLAAQGVVPSNSFGLHIGIGAEELKLNLSLWLGGFDASRIVGPVSSQSIEKDVDSQFVVDLLDIAISVDHGGSPFSYLSQEGLLSSGNSSISSSGISVTMNPGSPYMYLPNSTCAAIAKNLPVDYNAGKALYLWNVADPQYAKIVTSPTYLSFVFRGSNGNLTIKAPFQLLNLTLEAPLVSNPIPYFPCQPPQAQGNSYSLGRAFLQAAFIGVSWTGQGEGEWYLAQAPGPNTDSNPQNKPITGAPPVGLSSDWADTWRGFWTALPTSTVISTEPAAAGRTSIPTSRPSTIPTHTSSSLSGGPIGGIAVGGVCALLIAIWVGILLFQRRRGRLSDAVQPATQFQDDERRPQHLKTVGMPIVEEPVRELPGDDHDYRVELL